MAKPKSTPAALVVEQERGERDEKALARALLRPEVRHAYVAASYAGKLTGGPLTAPDGPDYIDPLQVAMKAAEGGDLAAVSRMLIAQALNLDAMFTEFARRSALNMGEHLPATEKYGRLALKAQTNCRTTLEALARLHQPREQTVRHVHVNDGGQAVIAEQFHHHTGGPANAESDEQSHATAATGGGGALPRPDAPGVAMPVAGGDREAALQDARRDQPWRAEG